MSHLRWGIICSLCNQCDLQSTQLVAVNYTHKLTVTHTVDVSRGQSLMLCLSTLTHAAVIHTDPGSGKCDLTPLGKTQVFMCEQRRLSDLMGRGVVRGKLKLCGENVWFCNVAGRKRAEVQATKMLFHHS